MKVGVFLLLLLSIGSSLRAPTVSWRCRRSRWCASTAGGEDPTPPTGGRVTRAPIYALQRSLVSPEATLKYLQSWATEAVTGTGTAIKLQSKFNGVRFLFAPAPAAYLDFDVVTGTSDGSAASATDGDEVVIQMAFASADGDASQVRSLVNAAAQSLYSSLLNDIGALIMQLPDKARPAPPTNANDDDAVTGPTDDGGAMSTMDRVQQLLGRRDGTTAAAANVSPAPAPALATPAADKPTAAASPVLPSEADLLGMWSAPAAVTAAETAELKAAVARAREQEEGPGALPMGRFDTARTAAPSPPVPPPPAPAPSPPPTPAPTATAAVTPVDATAGSVLHSYPPSSPASLPSDREQLRACVRGWADSYAGRGAGIEADDTATGVRLTFLVGAPEGEGGASGGPGAAAPGLDVRVVEAAGNVLQVQTFLSLPSSPSPSPSSTASASSSVGGGGGADVATMVRTAAANVLKGLKKELDGLAIGGDAAATQTTGVPVPNTPAVKAEVLLSGAGTGAGRPLLGAKPPRALTDLPDEGGGALREAYDAIAAASDQANRAPPPRAPSGPGPGPGPQRKRDPAIVNRARAAGVRLEKFEDVGLEEQAVAELTRMVESSRQEGFLAYVKQVANASSSAEASIDANGAAGAVAVPGGAAGVEAVFAQGTEISQQTWQDMLARQAAYEAGLEDLSAPPTKLPINLKAGGLAGGIDIFEGPPEMSEPPASSIEGQLRARTAATAAATFANAPAPAALPTDERRLQLLVTELGRADAVLHESILDSYRDLLLSDNILFLLKRANATAALTYEERLVYGQVAQRAAVLAAELGALVRLESVRHLQTIHDVCEVAAAFQHDELTFLARMDDLRPRFDTALLAYLRYALASERDRLKQAGGDPDRLPSTWMQVLTLVQNGVLAEFEARYERLLEPLLLAMRFHAYPPTVRRDIFRRLVNLVAVPDLPYLRELAVNMVDGVRATPAAQLPDPSLPDAVDALAADLEACLAADEVDRRLSEFKTTLRDTQGQTMVAVPRNPLMRAELAEAEEEAAAAVAAGGRLLVEGGVGGSVLDKASSASSAVAAKAGVPAGKTASAPNGGGGANGGGGGGLVGREALETHAVDTASAPDPHKSNDASDGDGDGKGGKDKGYLIGFG